MVKWRSRLVVKSFTVGPAVRFVRATKVSGILPARNFWAWPTPSSTKVSGLPLSEEEGRGAARYGH